MFLSAKVVQIERKTKKNSIFLFISEREHLRQKIWSPENSRFEAPNDC